MALKKKQKKSYLFLPVLLTILVIILVLIEYQRRIMVQEIVTSPPTPIPTIFFDNSVETSTNWKTYNDKNYGFTFKYPDDWFIVASTWSGRDNYFVIHNNKDASQCIGFEPTSSDKNTLDEEIRLAADGYGGEITEKNVIAHQVTTINGKDALIEQINLPQISQWNSSYPQYQSPFLAAGINYGSGYLIIDTCSLKEKNIFKQIFDSIKFKQ